MEKVDKFLGKLGELALLPEGGGGGGSKAGIAHRDYLSRECSILGKSWRPKGAKVQRVWDLFLVHPRLLCF